MNENPNFRVSKIDFLRAMMTPKSLNIQILLLSLSCCVSGVSIFLFSGLIKYMHCALYSYMLFYLRGSDISFLVSVSGLDLEKERNREEYRKNK